LRSRSAFAWLLRKEWRELAASRAWWVLLLVIGPLVGVSFISAVRTYAELSGYGGSVDGVGSAFSPLVGVWAPTFSACELAAAFLLPFVAIRVAGSGRQSGALKLELQRPMPAASRIGAKALVLMAGWAIATLPALLAVALWRAYGGSIYLPELGAVLLGHLLNGALTIAVASAAASITDHPSTAAIVTLSVTVGTWVLSFIAAVQGGLWERAADYTPTAMVGQFQHGLVRADVLAAGLVLTALGLALAAIWTRIGVAVRRRAAESFAAAACAAIVIGGATFVNASADLSENRMNSFPRGVEQALVRIDAPLIIRAHLAPEDPRRVELEQKTFSKLRRAMAHVDVTYHARSTTGLFEQADPHYGEIEYELANAHAANYQTNTSGVLRTIYDLAGIEAPGETDEYDFRGHPLRAPPTGASQVFYIFWPAVVIAAALLHRRRGS
jgi:hypothetical protein